MKKIFSIFLIAFAALTGNVFSAEAQTAGQVQFRLNVKDAYGNPVSGVKINATIVTYDNASASPVEKSLISLPESGSDGGVSGTTTFNLNHPFYADFASGARVWRPSSSGAGMGGIVNLQYINFSIRNPQDFTFADANSRLMNSASRNVSAKNHTSQGGYQNCYLSGSWDTNGAIVVFDIVVVNLGIPKVTFDTSQLSNASAYTTIEVQKGNTIDPTTIPTPVNINTNKTFQYWSTDGKTEFDFTQPINSDIRLIPVFYAEISFDTTSLSNASDYPTLYVPAGSYYTGHSSLATPVLAAHNDWTFLHWSTDGVAAFDFSQRIYSDVKLIPVFTNPNLQGIINIKAFLWDHNSYNNNPYTFTKYGIGYTHKITRASGRSVMSNLDLEDYQTNPGWTDIPVSGLRFKLYMYNHASGARDINSPRPVGVPATSGWQNDMTISTATTYYDAYGQEGTAEYIIPSTNLQYLTAGCVIDLDPDPNCIAWIVRNPEYGREYCSFDYDWVNISSVQNAGLVGVRYIKEGVRHDDTGILLGDYNDNDALLLTQDNVTNGFECTFYCYVTQAPIAQFDLNGGTINGSSVVDIQKFKPVNSAGITVDPWRPQNPGTVTPPDGMEFLGWYEIRTDIDGNTFESPTPFAFGTEIDRSIYLKAKYAAPQARYTMRWAPQGWDGSSDSDLYEKGENYLTGDIPSYGSTLPSESGTSFTGWALYEEDENGTESFGSLGNYRYVKFIKHPKTAADVGDDYMVYNTGFWRSPYAVNEADQIYRAVFRTALTVTKSGLKAGDSAVFTISNGTETRKIVLTGNTAGTAVSKTLYLDAGTWTVTEEMGWSWAYENSTSSKNVTIADGAHETVTFTNSPKSTTPQHGESSVNNTFSE